MAQTSSSVSCWQRGENNSHWAGDDASYTALLKRIYTQRGSATECVWGCEHTHYEWAHNLGEVGEPEEYVAMCVRCHRRFDKAIAKMQLDPADDSHGGWRPGRYAA
jgi:hypothetical protein